MVRGGTKRNEKIYINHLSPLQSRRSIIAWNRLKFIILRYLRDALNYRLPVCAFVYRVRDCKHPVLVIYINDNNLQVRCYI